MAIYAGIFCELKPDRGAFFPPFCHIFSNDRCTRSFVSRPLAGQTSRDKGRSRADRCISQRHSGWTGAAHSRLCSDARVEGRRPDVREQVRPVLEIQSIERATSEPLPSVPLPAASRPVGDSAPKKAKVVQSTLVGYVLLHRKDDPHSPRAPPRTESY